MDLKLILASVTAGLAVFTYFSLPILREMYGDVALLAVYAGLGLLSTVFVYTGFRKIRDMSLSKSDKDYDINKDSDNMNENNSKDNRDHVEKEIKSLKE